MSRRMDIELTSTRADGLWTWRAAGAKQPRGEVSGSIVPPGSKIGDVFRVETEIGLDGIEITSVLPPKSPHKEPQRIELVRAKPEKFDGVITTLVAKSERRGRDRRGGGGQEAGAGTRPRRAERRPGESDSRNFRPRRESSGVERPNVAEVQARRPAKPGRQRPARLVPKTVHRDALLSSLPVEQQPIAEQLALGGLPAVRRALAEQQTKDREAGRPASPGDAIVALAEQLLPTVREAVWLDRAETALERLDSISLRDLRATVTGASARTEEAKALLGQLRTALGERLTKLRTKWEQEISHALEEGRVLQALRLSAKPPEPSTRLPASLVAPLATAAGTSLNDSTQPERWIALLEAAANSPIRRSIKPTGMPSDPSNAVRQAANAAVGRVPSLAKLLGLAIPPPPRPVNSNRPAPTPGPSASDSNRTGATHHQPVTNAPAAGETPALDARHEDGVHAGPSEAHVKPAAASEPDEATSESA